MNPQKQKPASSRPSDKITVYEKLTRIPKGKYGEVYRARIKGTEELVALKRIMTDSDDDGFPMCALTEITILKRFRHENMVHLYEVATKKGPRHKPLFFLVLEYCELNLANLIGNLSVRLELPVIKMIMKQIFKGLSFIHNFIVHGDIRPSNILLTRCGLVKLADFQSARFYSPIGTEEISSSRMLALWYRPPEWLIGRNTGPKSDMWSAGCIMAELWIRVPILQGYSIFEQIALISILCGTINSEVFPGADNLYPLREMRLPRLDRLLRNTAQNYFQDLLAVDLFDKLLTLHPRLRIDSTTALNDPFFLEGPRPSGLAELVSSVIDSTVISEGKHQVSLESCGWFMQ